VVLTSFQRSRIISRPAILAEESGAAATGGQPREHELELALQRYQGGAVGYLEVVTAQTWP